MTIIVDLKPAEPYTGIIVVDIILIVIVMLMLIAAHTEDVSRRGKAKILLIGFMIIWMINIFALGVIQFKT